MNNWLHLNIIPCFHILSSSTSQKLNIDYKHNILNEIDMCKTCGFNKPGLSVVSCNYRIEIKITHTHTQRGHIWPYQRHQTIFITTLGWDNRATPTNVENRNQQYLILVGHMRTYQHYVVSGNNRHRIQESI